MAAAPFQERYFIGAPVEAVYAHLSEPINYIGLSPVLIKVTDITHTLDAGGKTVINYKAVEELRYLGFIKYHNPIRVALTLAELDREMLTDVKGALGVSLRFSYLFEASDGGTWITESVETHVPMLLHSYIIEQAKSAQRIRVKNLKARMEVGN